MDLVRRNLLATGTAAAAMAAAPGAFPQQAGEGAPGMQFYERGPVRSRYQETGSGLN